MSLPIAKSTSSYELSSKKEEQLLEKNFILKKSLRLLTKNAIILWKFKELNKKKKKYQNQTNWRFVVEKTLPINDSVCLYSWHSNKNSEDTPVYFSDLVFRG